MDDSAIVALVTRLARPHPSGGRVIVIGPTGRNFAAGMSGGIAFVLDADGRFERRLNREMVDLEPLEDTADADLVRELLTRHVQHTGSRNAARLLCDWSETEQMIVKILPREYKRALQSGVVQPSYVGSESIVGESESTVRGVRL